MITKYHPNNKQEVLALLQLNTPKYFATSEEKDFIEYLDNEAQHYYVVMVDDVIVGAGGINYFTQERIARVSWDILHPDFQGKGWGTKLVKYRISEIKNREGIEKVIVRTSQLAHKFYAKCGFTLNKVEKDFWAKGFDLFEMEMPL